MAHLSELIKHPDKLNKETLYDLRSLVALYPYYQTARVLMLKNLYLLHDPSFDEELRRAAAYITDRKVIFNLVEAEHYKLKRPEPSPVKGNRTVSLIDNFLSSIPSDADDNTGNGENIGQNVPRRQPTATDATVDYAAYLMQIDFEDEVSQEDTAAENNDEAMQHAATTREMKGANLIDDFINKDGGRFSLSEEVEYTPEQVVTKKEEQELPNEDYLTETLAGIYIKQGKYSQALEIIKRLNLINPKKNAYFADQIRFLEKLIVNDRLK